MSEENLLQTFLKNVARFGQRTCLRYKENGAWKSLNWLQVEERVCRIGCGLAALGVKKGEAVALFSATRPEWTLTDLGIISAGAVTVPIYQSSTAEQASYIIEDSEAKAVFVENPDLLKRIRHLHLRTPSPEGALRGEPSRQSGGMSRRDREGGWLKEGATRAPIKTPFILFEGSADRSGVLTLSQLMEKGGGREEAWRRGIGEIRLEDVASCVYTSGTTGPPKGAILTHGNFAAEVEALARVFDITDCDEGLIFLPLAHIVARALQFFHLRIGFAQAYAESIDKLADNLSEIRPHFFVGVPRIFEKVYERIHSQVQAGSPLKKGIFAWAFAVGRETSRRQQEGGPVSFWSRQRRALADFLVFRKLKARLGGRLRYAVSGGAPLSKEIAEFFAAAGIVILEGYGLTETTAAINCNRPGRYKFGSVGPAVWQVEEKVAADGEILVRGPVVFQGYFKKPEATREAFTPEGWFRTGDIGEFDADGFLRITDRKKDIIVTAGGKNVAPQNIENLLKTVPYISQVMVLGDRQKYLAALVTLNRDPVERFAREVGIRYRDFRELVIHPKIHRLIQESIEEKNRQLASFESVKKFAILENDFTQESGELTPTLKVKRKFVSEKYKDILAALYRD